jgi:GTP cyclohydrolase IA
MRIIDIKEWHKLINDEFEGMFVRNEVDDLEKEYTGVFGVPRGGTLIALELARALELPLLDNPIDGCLVVDDLIDSGRTMKKYEGYEFRVLIDKRKPEWKDQWIEFWYENTQTDDEDIVTRMLERIGENPNREGLIDTPKRVVKMWNEIFRGYDETKKPKITVFDNGVDGLTYDNMVVDTGDFYSQCEHHMVPFFGNYWFAYVPDKKILGISKVARIVDHYASKLQIQERLVKEVLDEIEKAVQPKGIALVMKGEHLCKTMRGVKKKGFMVTSDLRGVFKDKPETRAEFMRFVK